MKKMEFEEKLITVTYNGSVKHAAGERHSCFIKENERNELQEQFHKGPNQPSMVYQTRKTELPSVAMASGNRTVVGFNQLLCEKSVVKAVNYHKWIKTSKSLEKVRQKLIKEEASRECPPDPAHGGFVHSISYRPLIVHMWIEDQLQLWHHRCGDDIYHT